MVSLDLLIRQSRSAEDATAHGGRIVTENDQSQLANVGRQLLSVFPPIPGACLLMSALYAARLQELVAGPILVIAGGLSVGSEHVFGAGGQFDGKRFDQSNPSWDGHAWVELGDLVADVSIFRTAYSGQSHPLLRESIAKTYGRGRGLMIRRSGDASDGLTYEPQYVLTEDQVTGLARGALKVLGHR